MFDLIIMDQMVSSCLEASSDKENTISFINESMRKVVRIGSNTLYFVIASLPFKDCVGSSYPRADTEPRLHV